MRPLHPSFPTVLAMVLVGASSVLGGGSILVMVGPHQSYFTDFVTGLVTVLLASLTLSGLVHLVLAVLLWRTRPWRNER